MLGARVMHAKVRAPATWTLFPMATCATGEPAEAVGAVQHAIKMDDLVVGEDFILVPWPPVVGDDITGLVLLGHGWPVPELSSLRAACLRASSASNSASTC